MRAPYRWICDYADGLSDVKVLADKMIMTGNGVEEIEVIGENIVNVVVGRIEKIEKHPDADKLQICRIDVGDAELLQIVTAAQNVFEGAYVPVAKAVATLPMGTIKKGKLRGVESFGMLCSGEEFGLKEEDYPGAGVDGILILRGEPQVGMDIRELLSLSGAVIDFEVGANRPDCLSILGIAREAAAAEQGTFTLPEAKYTQSETDIGELVCVDIQAPDLCTRYIAGAALDVKIEPSPEWMRLRLREAGIRPINNIVDITNFVMLETGQPMHAFDARDIRGSKIIVRRAQEGEKMKTLDDKERVFNENMLLICDEQGPVGVAGVMGGLDSEIKDTTTRVVFESAKFGYGNIRQTSRALGLSTESSMRFSKGVDAQTTMFAMQRALTLVEQLGAGKVAKGLIDVLNEDLTPKIIKTNASRVNARLGTSLSAKDMQKLLTRAYIQTGLIGDELICTVPSFRSDIFGVADIAEEVARMFGYDNIPETNAQLDMRRGCVSNTEAKTDRIKLYLRDAGYSECITYSFIGAQDYAKIGMEVPDSVKIINPLGDDSALMRTTLVPHMLGTVSLNLNRKSEQLKLYEIARGYFPQADAALPEERPLLCMATTEDFFALKGVVENLVAQLTGCTLQVSRAQESWLHPGMSANLLVGNTCIGVMGRVHPDVAQRYDIGVPMVMVQMELNGLFAMEKAAVKFKALPKYPAATRDIAVIVEESVGAGDMMNAIAQAGSRIEDVQLFDVFRGEKIGADKKSVAFAITMRSAEGTMTDSEADALMAKILKTLESGFGAKLRD